MASSRSSDTTLILFGDQTGDFTQRLEQLLQGATRSTAQRQFLEETTLTLKLQIRQLPPIEQDDLPCGFNNIHDLLRGYNERDGPSHPALCSALLCITQLLQVFRYFEGASRTPNDGNVRVVGLCTGSIAAAAFSCCSNIDQLMRLAVPSISIAFQTGVRVARFGRLCCNPHIEKSSWSIAVSNSTESEISSIINVYDKETDFCLSRRCWLSAFGSNSVTVSGPPPALEHLKQYISKRGIQKSIKQLQIYGPYHASHLESHWDLGSFLSQCNVSVSFLAGLTNVRNVTSACTGRPVRADNALDLMGEAVESILFRPVRIELLIEGFVSLNLREESSITLISTCPTTAVEGIVLALKQRTKAAISKKELCDLVVEWEPPSCPVDAPLAIVGTGCRFPGADTPEELWELLVSGRDMHRTIPKDRFDINNHVDPTLKRKNTSSTPYGCFIDQPGNFDPRFFNMSPSEAAQTDPMQRLALVTAYEALEMSGFVPNRSPSTTVDRVGTFYGQTSDDYRDTNATQKIGTYFITGGIRAFGPGRINYFFGLGGPSYNVDTACSSSLAAIHLACTSIRSGHCDTAVAGGLSVLTSPDLYAGLSRGHFLSKTGSCKTFDQGADGYCRADGIGTVVIKRLADAERDNDKVLAVVLGTGTNHSADAVSFTHPHSQTQARLFRDVIEKSGISPLDVDYVEMHGTGTQAGDGAEVASVVDVVAPLGRRKPDNPVYVGSIKPNIGHGEASAGVASLIKAMLMLEKEAIPPHIGIKTQINRGFPDLESRNVRISTKTISFKPSLARKRTILVNSFSAAGGNTTLLLQDPPISTRPYRDPRPTYAVTVSGHSALSLNSNLKRMIDYLDANPNILPGDLSYTTMARRMHKALSVTVTGKTISAIKLALENKRALATPPSSARKRPIVFVFTGQGASYPSLACDLYRTSAQFRSDIDSFNQIALQQGFPSFTSLIDGSIADVNILSAAQMQVGLVCIQIALTRLWQSWGIQPSMVLGHSLGEYAALQSSGVLSISDTIFLVGARARLLEQHCQINSHSMLAAFCSQEALGLSSTEMEGVDIACLNSPHETVLAGDMDSISELECRFHQRNIRTKKLAVPYAFHSAQIDPILNAFGDEIEKVRFATPQTPIISPVTGQLEENIGAQYLLQQTREKVQFAPALERVKSHGAFDHGPIFLEIGPHPICSEMIKSTLGRDTCTLHTIHRKENPWTVTVRSLAALHDKGYSVNWAEYYREFEKAHRVLVLPSYAFDNSNYWIDYRNDWSLRKGDPPETVIQPEKSRKLSTYLHRIVEENYSSNQPTAVYETDLRDEKIHSAISGHRVNGCALCPSSLYATIALAVADHQQNRIASTPVPLDGRNLTHMEITHPLIVSPIEEETRVLRIKAELNQPSDMIRIQYSTMTSNSKEIQHGSCSIRYGTRKTWLSEWARNAHLVQERIATLEAIAATGEASRVTRKLAYRLFRSLVDYAPDYQLMHQVVLASSTLEASCKVELQGDDGPHWVDALAHISGFVLNANEDTESTEAVYISHGWGEMRFGRPLQAGSTYHTYVKMTPQESGLMDGNVWILSEGVIVGLIEGIQFQKISRRALNTLLPAPDPRKESAIVADSSEKKALVPQQPRLKLSGKHAELDPKPRDRYRQLVAEELGLAANQLHDDDNLFDIGLDSLMSLTLTSRLRDESGIQVSHQQVYECATIGELLGILDCITGTQHGTLDRKEDEPQEPALTNGTKSWTDFGSQADHFIDMRAKPLIQAESTRQSVALMRDNFSGTNPLPSELLEKPEGIYGISEFNSKGTKVTPNQPSAKSILLQRRSNLSSKKYLFLFPDGSGSPASYAQFGHLSPDFDVYGLVCPYLKMPHAETNGLSATVELYLTTIREYQPHGPYHLGGWSIGGVYAYEAANRLARMQEQVALLLLIDSPCPSIFPPMNSRLIELFEALGVFDQMPGDAGGRCTLSKREQALNHFKVATKDLADYRPVRAITGKAAPRVFIFWAQNGVCEDQSQGGDRKQLTEHIDALGDWMLSERTDFGPCGWDSLWPVESMTIKIVPGNHFTMMQKPNIGQLSSDIREILRLY